METSLAALAAFVSSVGVCELVRRIAIRKALLD